MISRGWRSLQHQFLAGLLVVVPAWGTVLILRTLLTTLDRLLWEVVGEVEGAQIPGMGLLLLFGLLMLIGMAITHLRIGQRLLQRVEVGLQRVPVVRSVYVTMKSMTDVLRFRSRFNRSSVVIFPFPRDGLWAIGFVMGTAPEPIQVVPATPLKTVFVPTAIHPFTGYLAFIPERNLVRIDLPPEEALKIEFSAGLYWPGRGSMGTSRCA